ncbi:hypothetical protein Dimus_016629, partial [Dionaea muscipula]
VLGNKFQNKLLEVVDPRWDFFVAFIEIFVHDPAWSNSVFSLNHSFIHLSPAANSQLSWVEIVPAWTKLVHAQQALYLKRLISSSEYEDLKSQFLASK